VQYVPESLWVKGRASLRWYLSIADPEAARVCLKVGNPENVCGLTQRERDIRENDLSLAYAYAAKDVNAECLVKWSRFIDKQQQIVRAGRDYGVQGDANIRCDAGCNGVTIQNKVCKLLRRPCGANNRRHPGISGARWKQGSRGVAFYIEYDENLLAVPTGSDQDLCWVRAGNQAGRVDGGGEGGRSDSAGGSEGDPVAIRRRKSATKPVTANGYGLKRESTAGGANGDRDGPRSGGTDGMDHGEA